MKVLLKKERFHDGALRAPNTIVEIEDDLRPYDAVRDGRFPIMKKFAGELSGQVPRFFSPETMALPGDVEAPVKADTKKAEPAKRAEPVKI